MSLLFRVLPVATATFILALAAPPAAAHFVWVVADGEGSSQRVHAYFSEEPLPGEAHLVDRIKQSQVWLVTADGSASKLKLSEHTADDEGGWRSEKLKKPFRGAALFCDYGVFDKRGNAMRLKYYARCVKLGERDGKQAQPVKQLALDLVPELTASGLQIRVLWQGKPAKVKTLHVVGPKKDAELKPTSPGVFEFTPPGEGLFGFRAGIVDEKAAGKYQGKKFTQTRHYGTLTLDWRGEKLGAAEGAKSATQLLAGARASRAVWQDFPGLDADLSINAGGKVLEGTISIEPSGSFTWSLEDAKDLGWAKVQLRSLIMHRMPDGSLSNEATFPVKHAPHPLGRLIELENDSMGSIYRIKDDMVCEVNRDNGKTRFTISVVDVERNAEGKYLPRIFAVNTWNRKSGELVSSQTISHAWKRIGKYDVPVQLKQVLAAKDTYKVRTITLNNHRLGKK